METSTRFLGASLAALGCGGLLLLTSCNGHGRRVFVGGGGGELKEKAERTETHSLAIAPGEELSIDVPAGAIRVIARAEGEPKLTASLSLHARTAEEAQRLLEGFKLVVERTQDGPKVRLSGDPVEIRTDGSTYVIQPAVDLEALVPEGVRLHAHTSSGEVKVQGPLGPCDLSSDFGEVSAENVSGRVRLHSSSGALQLRKVGEGEVDLETSFGSVTLSDVSAKKVRAVSNSGEVKAEGGGRAEWVLETDFGRVAVRGGAGTLSARTSSGEVAVEGFDGEVKAKSGFGAVKLDGVLRSVSAASNSGAVSVTARPGSDASSGWTLSSDFGDVTLSLPEGFSAQLSAETSFGSVSCDFPLSSGSAPAKSNRLSGVLGKGGGEVRLKTSSGGIHIQKSGG